MAKTWPSSCQRSQAKTAPEAPQRPTANAIRRFTAAIPSDATTLEEVVAETLGAQTSERGGRLIDKDEKDSMERKKRDGYF